MKILISSGNSTDEVCRAIWHFKNWLFLNFCFEVIRIEEGKQKNSYKSILLQSDDKSFLKLIGTIQWKCISPFRPKHKRKNWYFSVICYEEKKEDSFDQELVIYQTMKSPKNGGQHVNTTNSGIRTIYPKLNIQAISYSQKSQYQNKKTALTRLINKFENNLSTIEYKKQDSLWTNSKEVQRGKAIKIFFGKNFKEVIS